MKSTRGFLTHRFEPGTGSHADRHKKLETILNKIIEVPEDYIDAILFTLMDEPIDIKLIEKADTYYIDKKTKKSFPKHPLTLRDYPHWFYRTNASLAGRIRVLVTIEELKVYVDSTETLRRTSLLTHLSGISDPEVNALLALHCTDILGAFDYPLEDVPRAFFSQAPGTKVMTLPVMIDGKNCIDFFELLSLQPHAPTVISEDEIRLHEYINPCTGKPIENIEVNYQLLKEIDSFLERARLQPQMKIINQLARKNDQSVTDLREKFANKSFMMILKETEFPAHKIPESLMIACVPGSQETILATHPVTLDNSITYDLSDLMKYWQTTKWGVNPLSGEMVQCITYDDKLRVDTVNFVLNLSLFQACKTPPKVQQGSYLRRENENWGMTMPGSFFSRRAKPATNLLPQPVTDPQAAERAPSTPPDSPPRRPGSPSAK